jgi:hypothetical protein
LDIPDLNSDVSCIQRTSLVMLDNDASVLWLLLQLSWLSIWVCAAGLHACRLWLWL